MVQKQMVALWASYIKIDAAIRQHYQDLPCIKSDLITILYSVDSGGKAYSSTDFLRFTWRIWFRAYSLVISMLLQAPWNVSYWSLIHDDLPAMDDDDYRRRLTNHKEFDGSTRLNRGWNSLFLDVSSDLRNKQTLSLKFEFEDWFKHCLIPRNLRYGKVVRCWIWGGGQERFITIG